MKYRVLSVIDRQSDRCVFDRRTSKAYFMDPATYRVFSLLATLGEFDDLVLAASIGSHEAQGNFQCVIDALAARGLIVPCRRGGETSTRSEG